MTAANHGKPWTGQAEEKLLRCFMSGMSLQQLCESQGRTPYAVVTRLKELGVLALVATGPVAYYAKVDADAWIGFKEVNLLAKEMQP